MYDKKEFKKKARERTEKLQKNLKELSNQLITDTEKLDKIIDSWRENLYAYSAYNIFSANIQLMRMKNKPVTALNSYKRWQKENRYVKKGERAIFVLAPLTYKKKDPKEKEDEMEEVISSFKSVPVFDISQTEGESLNYTKTNNKLISETNIGFEDLIKFSPAPVFLDNINGGGWTDGKRICINKESNNQNRICSLFHELAHYELHFDEGKRKTKELKELEAEAVSYCLSRLIGLKNDTAGAYLKAWDGTSEKLNNSGLEIIKTADKISRYLLKDIIT